MTSANLVHDATSPIMERGAATTGEMVTKRQDHIESAHVDAIGPIPIAFVIDAIRWATAGTENQVLRLIERLDRRRFTPYLVVLRSSEFLRHEWHGCEVLALGVDRLRSFRAISAIWRLRRWLRTKRIGIVQTYFRDANRLGLIAATLARVPVRLSSRRNLRHDHARSDITVDALLDFTVHRYMANGHGVKRFVVESERVAPEKVAVFHNLVDDRIANVGKETDDTAAADKAATGVRFENECVFVMIANLRTVKGHQFLLDAVERVADRIPEARFVLVGGGPAGEAPEGTEVFAAIGASPLAARFQFVGLQTDVTPYLKAADVGLLCSSSEGFSSTLLEYLAAGLPCIATDVGSNSESVLDGRNGFLVPYGDLDRLGDAIVKLYEDPALRHRMGREGRAHFDESFQPDVQIAKLEQFYCDEFTRRQKA